MSMEHCEYLPKCMFFNDVMQDMPKKSEELKAYYCKQHFTECARYIVLQALGRENVPAMLFPMQTDEAKRLIIEEEHWSDKYRKSDSAGTESTE
ncbi:MAG: hypothetical protein KJ893_03690 [Candidatus Omnitrophica bacterium]|nr:hypothetical protein [Candidatus Omnitrophota bacterium]MBU4479714.1 hypothetical protein [Candidatus Omnitrophota bacterium]MCG2703495.1 hypothetical protein [Candidatus Omnitrophota bacterium]